MTQFPSFSLLGANRGGKGGCLRPLTDPGELLLQGASCCCKARAAQGAPPPACASPTLPLGKGKGSRAWEERLPLLSSHYPCD